MRLNIKLGLVFALLVLWKLLGHGAQVVIPGVTNGFYVYPTNGLPIGSVQNLQTELNNRPTTADVLNLASNAVSQAATTNYVEAAVSNLQAEVTAALATNVPAGVLTNDQVGQVRLPGITNVPVAAIDNLIPTILSNAPANPNAVTNYDTRPIVTSNTWETVTGLPGFYGLYWNGVLMVWMSATNGFGGDGQNLTNLNAAELRSGLVPSGQLGSGPANAFSMLRGDRTWAPLPTGLEVNATNSTSGETPTAVWTNTVAVNNTQMQGFWVVGAGATNSYLGRTDALYRRDAGGLVLVNSNVLTTARTATNVTAYLGTNGVAGQAVLWVVGPTNEAMTWSLYGWASVSSNALPAVPVIAGVTNSTSQTNATVTWATDQATDSTVEYGVTASYGSKTNVSESVTNHSVVVGGLSANTTYYYRVGSTNSRGVGAVSEGSTWLTSQSENTLTNGLQDWFAMEANGALVGSSGRSLSQYGSADVVTGVVTNGLYLDGVNDRWSPADDNRDTIGAASRTWVFWACPSDTNGFKAVIYKDSGSNGGREYAIYQHLIGTTGTWGVSISTNGGPTIALTATNAGAIVVSNWYFVAIVADVTNRVSKIKVGTHHSTGSAALTAWNTSTTWGGWTGTNTTQRLAIGAATDGSVKFKGMLDEIGIYTRTLSDAEISALWNNGTGTTYQVFKNQ